jgi:uncharacterized membrane protein
MPPWLVLASLLGVIAAAACFLLFGRHFSRVTWYALVGVFAASLGQVVGQAVSLPDPLPIGDVNVLAATAGACTVVGLARICGL